MSGRVPFFGGDFVRGGNKPPHQPKNSSQNNSNNAALVSLQEGNLAGQAGPSQALIPQFPHNARSPGQPQNPAVAGPLTLVLSHSPQKPQTVQAWPTRVPRNATAQMFERLSVESVQPHGVYHFAGNVPSDNVYRGLIAHLLQAHGGPDQVVSSREFDKAVSDFSMANIRTSTGVRTNYGAPGGNSISTMQVIKREITEDAMGMLNADQQRTRDAASKLLNLYEMTLAVGYKYHFIPAKGDCYNCRGGSAAVSLDSGFAGTAEGGSRALSPTSPIAGPSTQEWTAENYYSRPPPDTVAEQIRRYAAHPSFSYPVHRSLNWVFKSPEDCRNNLLSGTGWIPPTACRYYREFLARELYEVLMDWDEVLDAHDTRVFHSWEELKTKEPEQFHKVAWRIVAQIHKIHMYSEESRGMRFFSRVESVKELFRKAKGSCYYIWKDGPLKSLVTDPIGKTKTFTYNQASNQRKKQRELEHVELHVATHGEAPPWKAGKKRGTATAQATRGRSGSDPAPLLMTRATAVESEEEQEVVSQGPTAKAKTVSTKRKRASKVAKVPAGAGDNTPVRQPKAKSTGAVRNRRIAPAPTAPPAEVQKPKVEEHQSKTAASISGGFMERVRAHPEQLPRAPPLEGLEYFPRTLSSKPNTLTSGGIGAAVAQMRTSELSRPVPQNPQPLYPPQNPASYTAQNPSHFAPQQYQTPFAAQTPYGTQTSSYVTHSAYQTQSPYAIHTPYATQSPYAVQNPVSPYAPQTAQYATQSPYAVQHSPYAPQTGVPSFRPTNNASNSFPPAHQIANPNAGGMHQAPYTNTAVNSGNGPLMQGQMQRIAESDEDDDDPMLGYEDVFDIEMYEDYMGGNLEM